jgi:hypothetical protein
MAENALKDAYIKIVKENKARTISPLFKNLSLFGT